MTKSTAKIACSRDLHHDLTAHYHSPKLLRPEICLKPSKNLLNFNDDLIYPINWIRQASFVFCRLISVRSLLVGGEDSMGSAEDEVVEIENLERGLLSDSGHREGSEGEGEDDPILYAASFKEMEENFVKYQTAQWVLYSLLLILAWGIGLFMLLYLPVRRYILRKDIRSRKLYLTPNSIVYKVRRPVPFPCFGVLKKEKHVLLPLVADVVIEQGYLQSLFGVHSLRIENVGVRRSPSDDVQIQGIANPTVFRKAVLTRLSNMKSEAFSQQITTIEDIPSLRIGPSAASMLSPSKSIRNDSVPFSGEVALLQKLEEVGNSVKRVETLLDEQHCRTSEFTN